MIKVRSWDHTTNRYFIPEKLDLSNKEFVYSTVYTGRCDLERFSGLYDKKGLECYDGDLRLYKNKIYKVVDDIWRFRFERNFIEFGENEDIAVNEDVVFDSVYIGNIHENMNRIKK